MNKTTLNNSKEKKINNNHYSRNETCSNKKNFRDEKKLFSVNNQLNKSMQASDDEQGINKLWPYYCRLLEIPDPFNNCCIYINCRKTITASSLDHLH